MQSQQSFVQAKFQQALALHQQGEFAQARALYAQVLAMQPQHLNALHLMGLLAYQTGKAEEALTWVRQALRVNPERAVVHHTLGLALAQLKQYQAAIASYDQAIALQANYADAHCNRGVALWALQQYSASIDSYDQAISFKPDYAQAHYNRGIALQDLEQYTAALASYDQAIALQTDYAQAYSNRGNALNGLQQYQAALESYDRAIALQPGFAQAYYNRGIALQGLRQYVQAIASYERAYALEPGYAKAHWNQSLCDLRLGNFERGWQKYEWRWEAEDNIGAKWQFVQALWRGQGDGGRVLVWGEQGPGDQVLYLSLLPSLLERVSQVTVAVSTRLVALVQRSFPQVKVVALGPGLEQEPCDSHIALGSVGQYLRTRWEDFAQQRSSYLVADPLLSAQLRSKLVARKPLVCGLSWLSTSPKTGQSKSIALRALQPILALSNFEFVDLQYGDTRDERAALQAELSIQVQHLDELDHFTDIDALAALINVCDVIVTVSNTTAHLAAALGKPVYLLLPYAHGLHWYWHEDRSDSPWYPSAHLYRQARAGDWHEVVAQVATDVCQRAGSAVQAEYAACFNRGNAAYRSGQYVAALDDYTQAIALKAGDASAYFNRGTAFFLLEKYQEAIEDYDRAIALNPHHAQAYNNRGAALWSLKQSQAALESYDRAIALDPGYAEPHSNRGDVLRALGKHQQAVASYDQAIARKADFIHAHNSRGDSLRALNQLQAAVESYEKTFALDANTPWLLGTLLHTKMQICDWQGLENGVHTLLAAIAQGRQVSASFPVLGLTSSLPVQRQAAQIWMQARHPIGLERPVLLKHPAHQKIRIGYYSSDYYNHATMYLMAELFERHDKNQFELIAFSFSIDQQDDMRRRVVAAVDQFIDVRELSDQEVVRLSRQLQIDIAVDLKGLTKDSRSGIFTLRAAPVQVNYLGYPGTMGVDYMDYLVADKTVVPEGSEQYYSEKLVYLPHSYQVNDTQRVIANKVFTRQELGLPASGFVFCSFNNSYKITPSTFEGWMRILSQVPGSVLWLLESTVEASQNLRREAANRGVQAERLVFAQRAPLAEHLARHRVADLFLDTLPYNAHTTASDALWTGLPVLTCTGPAFASRVAASLLYAMDMPELVTATQQDYEALAIALARDPQQLDGLKRKLARHRLTTPLFDAALFTRHLEDAYRQMYARSQAGEGPAPIEVQG